MSDYIEHAKNANLLEDSYDSLATLTYEDFLDPENVNLLVYFGDVNDNDDQILEIIDYATAYEAEDVTSKLSDIWEEEWGQFDHAQAVDDIAFYIKDHFEQDIVKELAENTSPVLVYSVVMNEDSFDNVPDIGSDEFMEFYAEKIIQRLALSPTDKEKLIDVLNNVPGCLYTVAVAGNIDPSVLLEDTETVTFKNPSVVVGSFETGNLWADEFDGNVTVDRFTLVKGDIIDNTYGGFHSECEMVAE